MHLANMHKLLNEFHPAGVIMDPVTNLTSIGEDIEIRAMLTRIVDFLKMQHITSIMTSLTEGGESQEQTDVGISSLMDTWLLVRMLETNGERNRLLYLLKSRGMAHSNQLREFQLTDDGIRLMDVYVGPGEVLTGTARMVQEAKDRVRALTDLQASEHRQRDLQHEQANLEAQAGSIAQRLQSIGSELKIAKQVEEDRQRVIARDRRDLSEARR